MYPTIFLHPVASEYLEGACSFKYSPKWSAAYPFVTNKITIIMKRIVIDGFIIFKFFIFFLDLLIRGPFYDLGFRYLQVVFRKGPFLPHLLS